jgi:hypothetical protein
MFKNRLPSNRAQSLTNKRELYAQLKSMVERGVINRSEATYWSQVLLVPNANGDKHLVIDYRSFNEFLEKFGGFIQKTTQCNKR